MIHDVRAIHLNKDEHIDDKVKLYMETLPSGRRHLVVETMNTMIR